MRISEFVGLTLSDIDLKAKKLTVDHQLQRKSNMEYVIEEPKTEAGKRVIPLNVSGAFHSKMMKGASEKFANIVIFGDHTLSIYKPDSPFFLSSDGVKLLSSGSISGSLLRLAVFQFR